MIITWENYEEYMMMYADDELQPVQVQALMTFINEHPQLKSELAAYERVHMVADTSVTYAEKETLLKPVPAKRIALVSWQRYAIAAGIAAILFLSVYKFREENIATETYAVEEHDTVKQSAAPSTQQSALPVMNEQAVVVKEGRKEIKTTLKQQQVVHGAMPLANAHTPKRTPASITPETVPLVHTTAMQHIDELPVAGVNEIKISKGARTAMVIQDVPQYDVAGNVEAPSFWDKLPLDDANKQEIKNIKNAGTAVAAVYDKVEGIKQQIHNATVSVRIEKRKLIVSF